MQEVTRRDGDAIGSINVRANPALDNTLSMSMSGAEENDIASTYNIHKT